MVTAGGAETLPFLASFGVLPASVAFFVLYGKMVGWGGQRGGGEVGDIANFLMDSLAQLEELICLC